jgi:hypothetical protein
MNHIYLVAVVESFFCTQAEVWLCCGVPCRETAGPSPSMRQKMQLHSVCRCVLPPEGSRLVEKKPLLCQNYLACVCNQNFWQAAQGLLT